MNPRDPHPPRPPLGDDDIARLQQMVTDIRRVQRLISMAVEIATLILNELAEDAGRLGIAIVPEDGDDD